MNKILIIAGSDPTSGAGLQSDCLTAFSLDVFPMTVATSITTQNDLGVIARYDLPEAVVASQLEGLLSRFRFDAVKIGMIGSSDSLKIISEILKKHRENAGFIVFDPVLSSSNSFNLSDGDICKNIIELLCPIVDLITPNLLEYEKLYKRFIPLKEKSNKIPTPDKILKSIPTDLNYSLLIKGGHFEGDATDILILSDEDENENKTHSNPILFSEKRINAPYSHGTGCTLSTAICSFYVKGNSIVDSIRNAKQYLSYGLQNPYDLGDGYGSISKKARFKNE